MFDEPLPKESDVRKLALKQTLFELSFEAKHLTRFASTTEKDQAAVIVDLKFDLDEQRRYRLRGTVDCDTAVICQRCMESMPLQIHCDVDIVIVYDDVEAKQLSRDVEPLVVADGELVDLEEVVEDELLLNMPFTVFHENEKCHSQHHEFLDPAVPAEKLKAAELDAKKDNPFSMLSQLKDD